MTTFAPETKASTSTTVMLGVIIGLLTIVSSWLIVGHGWISTGGENTRQIAVNVQRLDKLEENSKNQITRAEHTELLDRLTRLESIVPTRTEMDAQMKAQTILLDDLSNQLRALTVSMAEVKAQNLIMQQALQSHDERETLDHTPRDHHAN